MIFGRYAIIMLTNQWKDHFEDILLNIEDDLARVQLDNK
jgi:hypothetical protein